MPSLFNRLFTGEDVEERPAPAEALDAAVRTEPPDGMIDAGGLPSAANTLAELFPEEPAAKTEEAQEIQLDVAAAPKPAPERTADEQTAPKRRNIFWRLFGAEEPAATIEDKPTAIEESASARDAAEVKDGVDASEGVAQADVESALKPIAETPIPADALPPAADVFEELFPPESVVPEPVASDADQTPKIEADVPVTVPAQETIAISASDATIADHQADNDLPAASSDVANETASASADTSASDSSEEPAWEMPVHHEHAAEESLYTEESSAQQRDAAPAHSSYVEPEDRGIQDSQIATDATAASQSDAPTADAPIPEEAPHKPYRDWAFDDKLASHREWVESHGISGKRADLSGAELEATELISVNLRLADLHDANLRAADLLLADLRDACLVRADLEESCLVGANLEGANLEGASLETAMGLVPRQLAGANLRDAQLAPQLMEFEAQTAFTHAAQNAFRYFGAMSAASLASWLIIWKTRDAQLLTDSAIIPFLHSHTAAAALPTAESYLIAPVVVFILYLLFHFHLQRLWDAVQELPAIFPDGHTLGEDQPGIIVGLLRTHFRWMNPDPASTLLVERILSLLLAYWTVPATLLLFWARYLTRQEIHGTILQALLLVVATGIAIHATTKTGRPQERWAFERKWSHRLTGKVKAISAVSVAVVFGVILILLSAGTIAGVPHDRARAPQYGTANIRRWAPDFFWSLGFDPYADLTDAAISRRPATWNVEDDQVSSVDGARLNNAHFRYAQAYAVFLANAHLWRSDFQGAFLSGADMRGADLGESNMRFAVMDQAHMSHANLDRSNLEGADLRRADLRGANLSYCSLANAILVDARLDGASFYTARLDGATLTRAHFEKADLRDAFLGGAHMDHADLQGAYFWSARLPGADLGGAQLQDAIFIDADLSGANLGGAQLSGTVLNGANLSGTSLEGADLRGALGLTPNQVCSARSRRGALLSDDMETQVEAQCGKQ